MCGQPPCGKALGGPADQSEALCHPGLSYFKEVDARRQPSPLSDMV
jgi:hypothetical protein